MARYILSRDRLFAPLPEMWLKRDGQRPQRSWFMSRLRLFCPPDIAGHSLRAGGATFLAQQGVSLDIIQALGRWSSDTFRSYIRIHPTLLHASLHHDR